MIENIELPHKLFYTLSEASYELQRYFKRDDLNLTYLHHLIMQGVIDCYFDISEHKYQGVYFDVNTNDLNLEDFPLEEKKYKDLGVIFQFIINQENLKPLFKVDKFSLFSLLHNDIDRDYYKGLNTFNINLPNIGTSLLSNDDEIRFKNKKIISFYHYIMKFDADEARKSGVIDDSFDESLDEDYDNEELQKFYKYRKETLDISTLKFKVLYILGSDLRNLKKGIYKPPYKESEYGINQKSDKSSIKAVSTKAINNRNNIIRTILHYSALQSDMPYKTASILEAHAIQHDLECPKEETIAKFLKEILEVNPN